MDENDLTLYYNEALFMQYDEFLSYFLQLNRFSLIRVLGERKATTFQLSLDDF